MSNVNANDDQPIGWLKWIMVQIFNADRDIGLYIAAGFAVLFSAIMATKTGVSADGLQAFVWLIGKVVLGAAVAIILLGALRGSYIGRVAGKVLGGVATVYCLLGVTQLVLADRFTPPVARAACLANPFQPGCGLSAEYGRQAVEEAELINVALAAPVEPQVMSRPRALPGGAIVTQDVILPETPYTPPAANAVYIHFAGAIEREKVVAAAELLNEAGWQVKGSDRGGQRLAIAAGLNEVRYFNEADETVALELARQFAGHVDWADAGALKVRDLSDAGFNPASDHQFEIWTSRN